MEAPSRAALTALMQRAPALLEAAGRATLPDGTAATAALVKGKGLMEHALKVPKKDFKDKDVCKMFNSLVKPLHELER